MTTFFLDTSALVKQYRQELGTARVQALFDDDTNALSISELSLVELTSAFVRLGNQNEITQETMNEALGKFDADTENRFTVIELRGDLIRQARALVAQHKLRALDALQLASVLAVQSESPTFVSADERLIQAAQANGLNTLNPVSSA
ncbi:MAG: type II toxin-antitoxin system VapC family toxin [Chloroflexi bacterium]|nr:type II toxin-antitoxin system VapC family toxin [Chloroflexota bacterium]